MINGVVYGGAVDLGWPGWSPRPGRWVTVPGCRSRPRYADSRTTLRYDMSRANIGRHAAHAVAAYLAGMATD